MPNYKYKIFDTWYKTYDESFSSNTWYSEVTACLAFDILSERYPTRYEIHKIRIEYPIKTIG